MRILYLCADPGIPVLGGKGASVHLRAMARALSRLGARVVVASPRIGSGGEQLDGAVELVAIEPVLAKEHRSVASLRAAILSQAREIHALARAARVEAVYERLSLFSDGGVRTARLLGLPHLLEVNAPLREEALLFRTLPEPALAAELEASVLAGTDRIFAVSGVLAGALAAAGVEPRKIEVAPNGVDPADFPTRAQTRGDRFTIGFAGSLKPWHGVDVLLDAFGLAAREDASLRLEIVGTGPLAPLVERAPHVTYLGQQPHRATLAAMSRWHVGVAPFLPLRDFYFSPLKLVEYMASGICPVVSDVGDLRALLGDGERGVLVPAGDAAALATALVELSRDPARAAVLGARAREHVLVNCTWRRNARRVLDAAAAASAERAA